MVYTARYIFLSSTYYIPTMKYVSLVSNYSSTFIINNNYALIKSLIMSF